MSAEGNLPAARPGRARRRDRVAIVAFVVAAAGFAAGWLIGGRRTVLTARVARRATPSPMLYERALRGRALSALYVDENLRSARPNDECSERR